MDISVRSIKLGVRLGMVSNDPPVLSEVEERRKAIVRGLGFAFELLLVFQGGARLRDSDDFPGRKYFLAHAARELRNKLHGHVRALDVEEPAEDTSRSGVSLSAARRWVSEVSPKLDSFADAQPPSASVLEVPISIIRSLDPHMRREAAVRESFFDRMMRNFAPLRTFIPAKTLVTAVQGLCDSDPVRYCHVRSKEKTVNDSEVITLWDQLEVILFDLIGSPAWGYGTLDQTIDELNKL